MQIFVKKEEKCRCSVGLREERAHFFLHKHYNGCVPRMSARNTLGAGNELEPAYNAGLTDKGHFLGLERIQYDMPNKIQFCVDKEGLPVGCAENSGLTSEAQDKEKQGGGFNGEYVGAVRGCSPPL